jgi:cytochrome b6-f complex subunit 5
LKDEETCEQFFEKICLKFILNKKHCFEGKRKLFKVSFFQIIVVKEFFVFEKTFEIFEKQKRIFQFFKILFKFFMVEPLLSGIVLGLVPVTIAGLFVTAYLQYRRGDQATW